MSLWTRGILALCIAATLGSGAAWAKGPAEPDLPPWDASEAPMLSAAPETWPMQDGCPARTRATRSRAILDATDVAWTFKCPGLVRGDPLVWGDWVVVASVEGDDGALDVLRLVDGKPIAVRRHFKGNWQLDPILWQNAIYLSTGEVYRIVPELGLVAAAWKFPANSPFLVIDGDVIVAGDGFLARYRPGFDRPVWSSEIAGVVASPLTAAHGQVYVRSKRSVKGYEGTEVVLDTISLEEGARLQTEALGWILDASGSGSPMTTNRIVAGANEIFIPHPEGIAVKGGHAYTSLATVVDPRVGGPRLSTVHGTPVAWGPTAIYIMESAKGPNTLVRSNGTLLYSLASAGSHEEFMLVAPPLMIAQGVVFAAGGVFDAETRRVRGPNPWSYTRCVVPARETMLAVDAGGSSLVAYRAKARAQSAGGPRLAVPEGQAKVQVPGATAVPADGTVRSATLSLGTDGRVTGAGRDVVPLAEVGLVLDKAGAIVHGPDAAFVSRGLFRIGHQRTRGDFLTLGRRAVQAGDTGALRQLVADLLERGGKAEDVAALQKDLFRLAGSSAGRSPSEKLVREVAERRTALLASEEDLYWRAFSDVQAPIEYRVAILRPLLQRAPKRPEALEWLKSMLPGGIVPDTIQDSLEWLDVVEASGQTALARVATKDSGEMTPDERALASARATWRKDLVGLKSDRLVLVTPVTSPGRIAHCLSLGETVCSRLDELFGAVPSPTATAGKSLDPLVIELCASQEEYVRRSVDGDSSAGERAFMESTLGHYSPMTGVSRLFVPSGRDAFERVVPTFAHELTHHWVDRRMPLPDGRKASGVGPGAPCYFLEEGFARFVEEARIDTAARTWDAEDPRADSLDAVANAPRLLSWDVLFKASSVQFRQLSQEYELDVPMRWTLGISRKMSDVNLFYSQGGAACHWMYAAEGGKRRALLLAWIQDLHAGRTSVGDAKRRLGMEPSEAGDRITAWCRSVAK